jgi:hypothetical protein
MEYCASGVAAGACGDVNAMLAATVPPMTVTLAIVVSFMLCCAQPNGASLR